MDFSRPDVALVFAPVATKTTFVELGIPRLTAILKSAGFSVLSDDLNVRLLRQYFLTKPQLEWLAAELKRKPLSASEIPIEIVEPEYYAEKFLKFTADEALAFLKSSTELEFYRTLMNVYVNRRSLIAPRYYVEDVARRAEIKNEFLEDFFNYAFFDRIEKVPKFVGVSIIAGEQTYPAAYFSRMVKRASPETHVAWGGPWATAAGPVLDNALRAFPFVDSFMRYEAEKSIVKLAKASIDGGGFEPVPNLVWKDASGQIRRNEVAEPLPFDELPLPAFSDMPLYLYTDKILPVQTTRNCSYGKCVFCYHRISSAASKWQECGAANAARRMELYAEQTGLKRFFLADSCTGRNLLSNIADLLIEGGKNYRITAMSRSDGRWSAPLCEKLFKAGISEIYMGLESTSQRSLDFMEKGITLENALSDLTNMTAAGIATVVFILDYPTQSEEELIGTFEWVLARASIISAIIVQKFELGRNSPAFEEPERLEITIDERADFDLNVFSHGYAAKREVSKERFEELARIYIAKFEELKRKKRSAD